MDYQWVEDKLGEVNARLERLEAMFPKSGSATSGVEQENKGDGMAENGLQTERVTLEVTIRQDDTELFQGYDTLAQGVASYIRGELRRGLGESVRVVEETHFDDLAQVAMERDALIREHAEHSSALREMWRLSREACYERAAERDAAIREREEAVARAAEDARAYAAESHARAQAQQELQDRCDTEFVPAESAGSGAAERLHRETWLRLDRDELIIQRHELISRVAELEAASGGGEGEPVAWGVMVGGKIDQYAGSDALFVDKEEAQEWCHDAAISNRGTVVPLYTAPPQPRGWLTEEEREAVEFLASLDLPPCVDAARKAARIGKALLARSSPPEVVLPKLHTRCEVNEANHKSPCLWFRRPDVIDVLAAAGVAVKEVG